MLRQFGFFLVLVIIFSYKYFYKRNLNETLQSNPCEKNEGSLEILIFYFYTTLINSFLTYKNIVIKICSHKTSGGELFFYNLF